MNEHFDAIIFIGGGLLCFVAVFFAGYTRGRWDGWKKGRDAGYDDGFNHGWCRAVAEREKRRREGVDYSGRERWN